jgi:orotate phosphoribosyltransferase
LSEVLDVTGDARARLLTLIEERALLRGNITLASGKTSSYYIDGKMILVSSESSALIGELLYEMTRDLHLDAIGGPEVGAIPMATAAVIHYHRMGQNMEGFFVRKDVKAHGTQKRIEGMFKPGFRVAIVEDVMTTGGSLLQAVDTVQEAGGKVEAVICIVDRLQGGRQNVEARGLHFAPMFTIEDMGIRSA